MKDEFVFKPYGKSELGQMYVKNPLSRRAALEWINHEIASYPGLLTRLRELGYHRKQRMFTIAQVRAIVDALGEP